MDGPKIAPAAMARMAASRSRLISAPSVANSGTRRRQTEEASTEEASPPVDLLVDERLANRGFSAKLFHHQLVDIWELCCGTEKLAQHIETAVAGMSSMSAGSRAMLVETAVSRAYVLLRIIRGPAGIAWASEHTAVHHLELLLSTEETHIVLQQLAIKLLEENEKLNRGPTWASHREGRHASQSGVHALRALATEAGAFGAARASHMVRGLVGTCMSASRQAAEGSHRGTEEASPPVVLGDHDIVLALMAFFGNAPLNAQLHKGKMKVNFAKHYNSTHAGWGILSWGVLTKRCRLGPLSPVAFDLAIRSQSKKAKEQLHALGVDSAESLERKRAALDSCAKPLLSAAGFEICGTSVEVIPLLPSLVFVHACEFAQALSDENIGEGGVKKVLSLPEADYQAQVVQALQGLMREREPDHKCREKCYMQVLLQTALGRSASGASGGQSPSSGASGSQSPSKTLVAQSDGPIKHRGRKSALAKTARALRSARACTRTGVRVKKMHSKTRAGKGIMRKKRKASVDKLKYKDIVHCELCGCLVRRDVLPRHQESAKCLPLREPRGQSKQTSKKSL